MINKFLSYLKTSFRHPVTQVVLRLLSITSLLSTCITLGGFIFYTIGYSFLYGYFFSGTMKNESSLIDLLIKDIPFPSYSVILTSIAFILAILVFMFILYSVNISIKQMLTKGELSAGVLRFIITLMGSMMFHIVLTTFYVGGFPASSSVVINFSLIWVGPFLLAIFIYSFIRLLIGIYSALSGMLYGIIGITIIGSLVDATPSEIWVIPLFIIALLFSFFEHFTKFVVYRFFLWLPATFFVFVILATVTPYFKPKGLISWIITVIIIISISAFLGYFIPNKKIHAKEDTKEQAPEIEKKQFKIKSLITLLIVVLLSFLATTIPVIAESTGIYFRELTPKKARQTILYDNDKFIKNATLVANKNNIYYISNSEWRLILLRTEQIRVDEAD